MKNLSLKEIHNSIKDMDLDYLKSNLGTLDYLVRKGLRSFIGKGLYNLSQ